MPRRRETALCRLRIGHTRLIHGYLMCQDSQPCCSDCVVPLTVRHVVLECPSLNELQTRCFSSCRSMSGDFTLEDILGTILGSPIFLVFWKKLIFLISFDFYF